MKKKLIPEERYIYKKKSKKYIQQQNTRECWLITVKAIIETFNTQYNKKASEYASSKIHKIIKFSLPKQLSKILKKHNILHIYGKCKEKDVEKKIEFLKYNVKNWPVIILISHAYTKQNIFNIRKAIIKQHYISVRWYNTQKEVFYCYDSHTELRESNLPIGNIQLPYQNLISYRNFAGCWLFKNRYIATYEERPTEQQK